MGMSDLLTAIRSRGHWHVVVRPTTLVEERLPDMSALYGLVEQASVQLRGWDFPHLDRHNPLVIDLDWVGQDNDWEHRRESWRLYQSGQFVDVCGFWDDWRDRSSWWPPNKGWQPGHRLGIGDTLFRLTEIFEFAARLSMSPAGDESMHVEVAVKNLSGRVLFVDTPNRLPIRWEPKATINEFPFAIDLPRAELVSNARDQALRATIELFKRFGWDGSLERLRGWQSELGRR